MDIYIFGESTFDDDVDTDDDQVHTTVPPYKINTIKLGTCIHGIKTKTSREKKQPNEQKTKKININKF